MVCSDFAVLRKLYSGSVYSGKQRNIYEHIYRLYSPNLLHNPPVQKHSGPTGAPAVGNIYTGDK